MLWAFTRISALSWAPRRIRINLISLGADPTQPWSRPRGDRPLVPAQDVIAAIEALSRWPCVTGQCICLGA
jgi:NAD(P)-dependent dehydrogenase (short-subunit alcohol dehydrogenase family)